MARPEEPLNHDNLSLIVALYQHIATENPKSWIKGKVKADAPLPYYQVGLNPGKTKRPGRGRITRDICGYKITIRCEVGRENNRPVTIIQISAPGWKVHLRGREFQGREGEVGYSITRVGEPFTQRIHFKSATAQGLDRFKHEMTLIKMFADIEPATAHYSQGMAW